MVLLSFTIAIILSSITLFCALAYLLSIHKRYWERNEGECSMHGDPLPLALKRRLMRLAYLWYPKIHIIEKDKLSELIDCTPGTDLPVKTPLGKLYFSEFGDSYIASRKHDNLCHAKAALITGDDTNDSSAVKRTLDSFTLSASVFNISTEDIVLGSAYYAVIAAIHGMLWAAYPCAMLTTEGLVIGYLVLNLTMRRHYDNRKLRTKSSEFVTKLIESDLADTQAKAAIDEA